MSGCLRLPISIKSGTAQMGSPEIFYDSFYNGRNAEAMEK